MSIDISSDVSIESLAEDFRSKLKAAEVQVTSELLTEIAHCRTRLQDAMVQKAGSIIAALDITDYDEDFARAAQLVDPKKEPQPRAVKKQSGTMRTHENGGTMGYKR